MTSRSSQRHIGNEKKKMKRKVLLVKESRSQIASAMYGKTGNCC